jgi:hypothetical protein
MEGGEKEEEESTYNVFVGKLEGKRPHGRPRHRCVDNIKIVLRAIGCGDMDWLDLTQALDQWRALVNTVINLRAP